MLEIPLYKDTTLSRYMKLNQLQKLTIEKAGPNLRQEHL